MQDTIDIKDKNISISKRIKHNIVIYASICIILILFVIAFSDFEINEKLKSISFFIAIFIAGFIFKYHESTYYIIDFYSDLNIVRLKVLKFNKYIVINTTIDKIFYEFKYSENSKNIVYEIIIKLNKDSYLISNTNLWNENEIELLSEYLKKNGAIKK